MRINSLAAFNLALAAGMALAFPLAAQIENNAWRVAVEPETATEVPPYKSVAVVIRDADQLVRVLGNMETLNHMAGWVEDAGMHVVLPDALPKADAVDHAAAAAAAQAAAAAEQAAATQAASQAAAATPAATPATPDAAPAVRPRRAA